MKTRLNNLSKKNLLFTHGFAIHFGLIKAPRGVSVIMVAQGPGHVKYDPNIKKAKAYLP